MSGDELTVRALQHESWQVTKSGVSVDAGPTRIRQENAGPRRELAARARLLSIAPEGFRLALLVTVAEANLTDGPGDVNLTTEQWTEMVVLARALIAKAAP